MKIAIAALIVLSLFPIWKDPSTVEGLNFWQYMGVMAGNRPHLSEKEARDQAWVMSEHYPMYE